MAERPPLIAPEGILHLTSDEVDALLDRLEERVPVRPPLLQIPAGSGAEAVVFGDSHGDWRSVAEAVRRYREGDRALIGLGDYVDRSPDDCGAGSVANALYLLELAAERPDRVFLLQGNHETVRRVPAIPHMLSEEVDELWGPESSRYDRILGLLERGPLAAVTPSGAYLAHAGFPRGELPQPWTRAFDQVDDDRLCEIVWSECSASRIRRGAALAWTPRDLDRFLKATGLRVILRGHDPDVVGVVLYAGRCLTLHTTRVYQRYGGVVIARLPLDGRLDTLAGIPIEHLPTEGQVYPAVD